LKETNLQGKGEKLRKAQSQSEQANMEERRKDLSMEKKERKIKERKTLTQNLERRSSGRVT
jgi:hypothetical protein